MKHILIISVSSTDGPVNALRAAREALDACMVSGRPVSTLRFVKNSEGPCAHASAVWQVLKSTDDGDDCTELRSIG